MATDTGDRLLDAARAVLLAEGFRNLSTRRVADKAGVPLSQIHYHFGGREGLVMALLERENQRLVHRQSEMYSAEVPLSARYDQACDFLEIDVASGYVRVLQEMLAAGWSHPAVAAKVTELLSAWFELLHQVCREAEARFGSLGPFSAEELAALVGMAYMGGESLLLLGDRRFEELVPVALRRVGDLIRLAESQA